MSNKSYKSGLFKRIIDLGVVSEADVDDLVRIWRVATGDEKAITLQNFVQTVNTELGTGGLTLTEIVAIIEDEVAGISGDFVTLTTNQTITGEKNFNANTVIGDSSTDYVLWDKIAKVFSIFTQAQFIHKYRGGAAGALNVGQYDVNGNASINNTSNGLLAFGTNNTTRVQIEASGDVLLKKVESGTGETLMIEPSGRVVKGSGVSGGVQSVTGTAVDNTDPLNPVVSVDVYADNEVITASGFTDVIIPTSNTEYTYNFGSFDRAAPIGTTYEFEFQAIIIWQNATSINDFRAIINVSSNLSTVLSQVPTQVTFPITYTFKAVVIRSFDNWIQTVTCTGGSTQQDARIFTGIFYSALLTGSRIPKIGFKTPNSAYTSGDLIRFTYMKKTRVK